jgi:shikimate dehydrogenase
MQNAALEALGLGAEWRYEAIDVAPEDFEATVGEMIAGDFIGANVTIPHKEAALRLADTASPQAKAIGAANTLSFRHGSIHADNTDAGGLLDALRDLPASPRGMRALVLGAGGAARAVVWALGSEGARVEVWNRTASRAEKLCAELGGTPVVRPEHAAAYDLIVNSTSTGLRGENQFAELPLEAGELSPRQTIVDMVYGDGGSELLTIADRIDAKFISGFELLVRQGARSLQIWTGRQAPLNVMRNAVVEGLSR